MAVAQFKLSLPYGSAPFVSAGHPERVELLREKRINRISECPQNINATMGVLVVIGNGIFSCITMRNYLYNVETMTSMRVTETWCESDTYLAPLDKTPDVMVSDK